MTYRKKGILSLFALALVWGSFGLPIRYLSNHFSLFEQIYLRLFLAVIFAIIIFYKHIRWTRFFRMPKKEWLILLFRVIVLYGFAISLYTKAFTLTTLGHVSLLGAIPTTAVLGFILLREKVTRQKIVLILLSVIGILFITVSDPSHLFSWGRGDIFALVSDLFFSLSYIARKWQTDYLNNQELAVSMLLFGFILVFLLSLGTGQPLPAIPQISELTGLVLVGAGLLNVASIFLTNYGFAYVEAALANNIIALESFFAVLFGFIFFGEILTIQTLIGGLLILSSVVFLNKEEERNE